MPPEDPLIVPLEVLRPQGPPQSAPKVLQAPGTPPQCPQGPPKVPPRTPHSSPKMLGSRGPLRAPQSAKAPKDPRVPRGTPRVSPRTPQRVIPRDPQSDPKDPLRVPPKCLDPKDPFIVTPNSCPRSITAVPGQPTQPHVHAGRALRWWSAWVQLRTLGSSPYLRRARQSPALTKGPLPGCVQASGSLVPSRLPNIEEKLRPQRSQPFLPLPSCFPEILTPGCLIGPRPFNYSKTNGPREPLV